jgi:hypothetical protein
MLNSSRFALLAAAVTLTSVASSAQVCKKPAPSAPSISKVVAEPFQLKQVSTKIVNEWTTTSLYRADAVLTITPCATDPTPVKVPVKVELRTVTMLNKCGDGLTDGVLTLYAPATRQVITGPLVAVNESYGDLTGTLEGRLMGFGSDPVRLRAAFHGVFVQDAAGAYTLVNVDARGVTVTESRSSGPKK